MRCTIRMRIFQLIPCLILIFSSFLAVSTVTAHDAPNIVLIVADDLGYGELGCYGGTEIPTPNIDALARSGVRFTNGYVTAPFCAASRAALMTGRYQTRFGFEFNPIGIKNTEAGIGLPVNEKTIADRLREVGYVTGLIGKWHLGGTPPFHPQRRGFDEFFGFLHEGHYYVPLPWNGVTTWLRRERLPGNATGRWSSPDGRVIWSSHMGNREPDYDTDNPLLRSSQPINESEYLTDAITREACSFIDRHSKQPFFLYLPYNAVHSPMQASNRFLERFAAIDDIHRRLFAAMLSQLDDGVGQVIASLDRNALTTKTIVVFISDNGGPTAELTSSNHPLRGGKGSLWEGGIRVPFLLAWPGNIPSGRVVDRITTSMDTTVTALAAAGRNVAALKLDGEDLIPMLKESNPAVTSRELFWRVGKKTAIRRDQWKLVRERNDWELYDLSTDIGEQTDLAAKLPSLVESLRKRWESWNAEQVESLW